MKKRIKAWVILNAEGRVDDWDEFKPNLESHWGKKAIRLVEADPAADAVVRAAVRHFRDEGSRTHSNDCDVCAAVERYQKRKEKR